MAINMGLSSYPGKERLASEPQFIPPEGGQSYKLNYPGDRYRVFHMPAFLRQTGTDKLDRKIPRFELDWYAWIENNLGSQQDYSTNATVHVGPLERVDDYDELAESGPTDVIASTTVFITQPETVSISFEETFTIAASSDSTQDWGAGSDLEGNVPPVETSKHISNQQLSISPSQVINYGPIAGPNFRFGFLRFVVFVSVDDVDYDTTPPGRYLEALHVQEVNDATDEFSPLLGDNSFNASTASPHDENWPVSAFNLSHLAAMLDRYSREARYNQTVIMGEMKPNWASVGV